MSIPAGHIITVGGLSVIDRLQDTGLQNPRIPTEVVRETGNDLVVGKTLTEATFNFQMTSWNVNCDMMAFLNGKTAEPGEDPDNPFDGPSTGDAQFTAYKWSDCQFVHLACPWASDTTTQGGHITSGVLVPMYYPSQMTYKFGVTASAEQTVTLQGGTYYMSDAVPLHEMEEASAYPMEEIFEGDGSKTEFATSEPTKVYRIGGAGGAKFKNILGVLLDGVIQQIGTDYVEVSGSETGAHKPVICKFKFTVAPAKEAIIKVVYFSTTPHEIPLAAHAATSITPASVRGRNIRIVLGPPPSEAETKEIEKGEKDVGAEQILLRGCQTFDLTATHTGDVQRELGEYDPIGYNETGLDCNGTIQIDPKEEKQLYAALAELSGVSREEVLGYYNENPTPLEAKIYNPAEPTKCVKSIRVGDALLQLPGSAAKVLQVLSLPLAFESLSGSFEEVKGA